MNKEEIYEEIKFGDIEYFTLLRFQDRLRAFDLDRLGLANLDRLRTEIEIKVKRINLIEDNRRKALKDETAKK